MRHERPELLPIIDYLHGNRTLTTHRIRLYSFGVGMVQKPNNMKPTITIIFLLCSMAGMAQTKHVYYDTVKTVNQRVDFSPDTIPVYFKELVLMQGKVYDIYNSTDASKTSKPRDTSYMVEQLTPGFIIWQTYNKYSPSFTSTASFSVSSTDSLSIQPGYYVEPYKDSSINERFLYLNKKPVTNKVIYAVKR